MASGHTAHFSSLDQLLEFLNRLLREARVDQQGLNVSGTTKPELITNEELAQTQLGILNIMSMILINLRRREMICDRSPEES